MFVYLHGFNSSGQSAKAKQLRQELPEFEWLTPSYPPIPDEAIPYLCDYLQQNCHALTSTFLVGSSLGGYYAQYLAHKFRSPTILINPALDPVSTLIPYLGWQTNYYSNARYLFAEAELLMLKKYDVAEPCQDPVPTLLLQDRGDEIIPYEHALQKYAGCAECHVFEGGDHAFQHIAESVERIRAFERAYGVD